MVIFYQTNIRKFKCFNYSTSQFFFIVLCMNKFQLLYKIHCTVQFDTLITYNKVKTNPVNKSKKSKMVFSFIIYKLLKNTCK